MSGGPEVVVVLARRSPWRPGAHRPHAPVLGRPRDPAGRRYGIMNGVVPVRRPHAVARRLSRASPRPAAGSPPVQTPPGGTFGYLCRRVRRPVLPVLSDWEKQALLGSVFDMSFVDVAQAKLDLVVSRDPVCRTCNLDPINRLTEELAGRGRRGAAAGSSGRRGGQDRRRQRGRRGRPAPAGPRGAGRAAHPAAHPGAAV